MEKKWIRLYNKAMDFYNDGYINKSLDICEKILADDLSCSEVLNLKGLILYQKGLLKEARIIWDLNSDVNKDALAKKYAEDCKSDERREKIYKEAEQNLKKLNIDKALYLFNECTESTFNAIKVNTGIAMCYQKKGDNYRAKEYVDKALSIDREAVTANQIKKQLEDFGMYSGESGVSKRILSIVTALFVIGAMGAGGYSLYKKMNNNSNVQYAEKSEESTQDLKQSLNEEEQDSTDENSTEEIDKADNASENNDADKKFDSEKILELIQNKDVDNLYAELENTNKDNLLDEDMKIYNEALEIMKTDGVARFYESGVGDFNNGNYQDAQTAFNKAYKYSDDSYLKEHILFYKGSTASQLNNSEEALNCYKEYYKLYPKGSYVEGVLYEMALLADKTDKDMARLYAEKLMDGYPNSLYINDRIREILK